MKKNQWHPGFCSAVQLELRENREDLNYTREYNLNRKPLQIDLLVIRKEKDAVIKNEIGRIADSVLAVAMAANKEIFQKMKEGGDMCQELRELMEPEIKEELEAAGYSLPERIYNFQ